MALMPADDSALFVTSVCIQLRDRLENAIIFGDLPAGARLVEDVIAEQYGVSRSPVREALRWIEADGLLTREGAKGLNVAPMSRRDLDQIYTCRLPLERLAAAEAATHRSGANLQALRAVYCRLLSAQAAASVHDYFLANVALTDAVHAASENAALVRILRGLAKQAQRYRYAAYKLFPHLIDQSVEGSRRIIDAIVDQDADTAGQVTHDLIDRSWRTVRECFDA